jgi:hypothetical protein
METGWAVIEINARNFIPIIQPVAGAAEWGKCQKLWKFVDAHCMAEDVSGGIFVSKNNPLTP